MMVCLNLTYSRLKEKFFPSELVNSKDPVVIHQRVRDPALRCRLRVLGATSMLAVLFPAQLR